MPRERKDKKDLPSIEEAVERLSSISEMDFDKEISMASNEHGVILHEGSTSTSSMSWIYEQAPEDRIEILKDLFHVILHYLRSFYKKEYRYMANQQATEGLKAIMVVVGEAAKKLDQRKDFFAGTKLKSVTDMPEYKHLQEFYLSRIARKIDEGLLSKWIMGLSQRLMEQQREVATPPLALTSSKHVFVDMEAVKKDTEYELFFIRKENGDRFFSPRLIRNIKLVCDFGDRIGDSKEDDPLESISVWRDEIACVSAQNILQFVAPQITKFYHEVSKDHENDLPVYLGKALMALMLCSNSHNIAKDSSVKSCSDYFIDFQDFLQQALHTRDYEKMIAYPPSKGNKTAYCLLDLANALCQAFFASMHGYQSTIPHIDHLVQEALQDQETQLPKNGELSEFLTAEFSALSSLLKRHANGPLIKVLEVLEEGNYHAYDPVHQGNIPSQMFSIDALTKHIVHIHLPCPTHQEYMNKVSIVEEFKGFLRALKTDDNKHNFLVVNLQDRTSWRDHHRSVVLEELQKHPDFAHQLTVVTLPKDTEFYHQEAPYNTDNRVEDFLKHFKEHLKDENCGFFFPEHIKKALFPDFINKLLPAVHQVFFGNRNSLTRERRKDFIEIVYLFLELKLLELVRPEGFSLSCKDGVDCGPAASGLLYIFLKLMEEPKLSQEELEQLRVILHAPPLIVRERMMRSEYFHRMLNAIKEIELCKNEQGWQQFVASIRDAFGPLYKSDLLHAKVSVGQTKIAVATA